ncbi:MAG: thiamine pyrophosphate-dependent enzyme [Acidobacteriota bacterium]
MSDTGVTGTENPQRLRLSDEDFVRMLSLEGELLDGAEPRISDELALKAQELMILVRALDDRMIKLQRQGRISFHGTCSGEEAAVFGVATALSEEDWVVPALRQGAIMLYRGFSLVPFIAQAFSNSGDITKGRNMPSHQAAASVRQLSWSSCIANQLVQAVGIAKAMQVKGESHACVGFIGDGGTSEGDFHVALNMAATWNVPLVIVCQNNQWAISVPLERQTLVTRIADKAEAYGMEGVRVDGNDLLAVHSVMSQALEKARSGGGPTLVEALTYRVGAHSTSDDPSRYRDESITDAWRERDPLERLSRWLESRGLRDGEGVKALEREAFLKVDAAVSEVESLPPVAHETLIEDVFAEPTQELLRQWRDWSPHPPAATH